MILKLKRTPGIYLVGFMGVGKTTIGQMLADELGWSFLDLDAEIEREQMRTIAEIFEQQGESAFREMETAALEKRVRAVQSGRPVVIALGGGAFVEPRNFEILENNGVTVWLDCPLPLVEQRLSACGQDRPLARDPLQLAQLYEQRRPTYSKADYRVDGALEPRDIVAEILKLPLF